MYVASATDPVPPLTLYEIEYEIPAQIAYRVRVCVGEYGFTTTAPDVVSDQPTNV